MSRVVTEQRTVYRVPGGVSRFTRKAAYREAARVMLRAACTCYSEPEVNWFEQCRFHGERFDGYAFDHPDAKASRAQPMLDEPGEVHGPKGWLPGGRQLGDGGRAYYVLVRDRLARWLAWHETSDESEELKAVRAVVAEVREFDDPEDAHIHEDRAMRAVVFMCSEGHPDAKRAAGEVVKLLADTKGDPRWYS